RVGKAGEDPAAVSLVVLGRMLLRHEAVLLLAEPSARPWLVSPGEAEREVRAAEPQDLVKRPLQQALPMEPVVPVAETFDSVLVRQLDLGLPRFRKAKVVESQIGGQARPPGPPQQRARSAYPGPFRSSLAPPAVVLGNRMELGQIEGDEPRGSPGSPPCCCGGDHLPRRTTYRSW